MKRNLPFFFFNFGLRWNKSVYVLASSGRVDKYSSCGPCTDLSPRLYRHYSHFPDPDLHSCGTDDPSIAASRKMTFYSLTTRIHPSSGHLCAETMTVRVACSARCPGGSDSKREMSRGALRALASQGAPRCFASIPPTPPLAPPPTSLFAKVRAQSAELFPSNCLAGSGCRCYCFCVWFGLPRSVLFSLPWILSALAARALGVCVFKKLKKRGLWKRSWGLGSRKLWITVPPFFFFFFFNCLWLNSQKYKVNRLKQMDSFLVARGSLLTTETLLFVLFTINSNIY